MHKLLLACALLTAEPATVTLHDGSILRGDLSPEIVLLETEFGALTIPLAKIERIQFGAHHGGPPAQQFAELAKQLESDDFQERGRAVETLTKNRLRFRELLLELSESPPDAETRRLAIEALGVIDGQSRSGSERPAMERLDRVTVRGYSVVGKLRLKPLELQTKQGLLTIEPGDCEAVTRQPTPAETEPPKT